MTIIEIEKVQDHHEVVLARIKHLRRYGEDDEHAMAVSQTARDLGITEALVAEALASAGVVA